MKAWFDRWKFTILGMIVAVLAMYGIAMNGAVVLLIDHARTIQGEVIRLEKKVDAYVILLNRWNKEQDRDLDMMAGNLIEKGLLTDTTPRTGPGFNLIMPPPTPGILDSAPLQWEEK